MKKRLLSLALAAIMCVSLAIPALAAEAKSGSCGAGLTWTLDDGGTLTISGSGDMNDFEFEMVPWELEQQSVKSVVINSGATSIGINAFRKCYNLTSVTIPEGVKTIEKRAFEQCMTLSEVIIPDSVTFLGFDAFFMCYGLKSITLPVGITNIDEGTFYDCNNLKDIYYKGTSAQWAKVEKTGAIPEGATIHCLADAAAPAPEKEPQLIAQPTAPKFTDVAATSPYAQAITWAVEKGITKGTTDTTFSPGNTCTTAHILTFLWRAYGEPKATVANPFTDVKESDYFYGAALWAYENGMVSGDKFGGSAPCSRASTVTFMWQAAGKPAADPATFTDVAADADYAQAVAWAVAAGVTKGTTDTTFSPANTCTRGQIVTFLYRGLAK